MGISRKILRNELKIYMPTMEQKIVAALRPHKRGGLTRRELAKKLSLKKKQKEEVEKAIRALIDQNRVLEREGRLLPVEGGTLVPGEIVKVSGTFGFARPQGAEKDVFVPGRRLLGAMPGDQVMLRLSPSQSGELEEGEVIRITKQTDKPFSGVLLLEEGVYSVLADRGVKWPIAVVKGGVGGARPGDKVLVRMARRGERHADNAVRVERSFGSALNAAASSQAVLAEYDIIAEFPEEALEQARSIAATAGIHAKEAAARKDLRGEIIFTIDGADTKDIDDAVSLNVLPDGWELGVHIADVSHYVTAKSPLDEEAFQRGTSVYYADQVIPMLPPELSNGICSLNPGEDRLAFSCFVEFDSAGVMRRYRFEKSMIRSRVQGVYAELNALLEGSADAALRDKYQEICDTLLRMKELAEMLMENRARQGKIELASVESKIITDQSGDPVEIVARERGFCERLIEEFMLQANEAAATFAARQTMPFVYRVHDRPSLQKLEALYEVLARLGISFRMPKESALSQGLARILQGVEGGPYSEIVGTLVLRAMAKAKYSGENTGHFGIQRDYYAHFTSPIRRYPDLAIHRILSAQLAGIKKENMTKRYTGFAVAAAERSSQREIAAMTAERDCEDRYKAQYMRGFIGETLSGTVSGCTAYGAYVRLENTCEGLVRLADFPSGDWSFDGSITFTNRTGKVLRLGDSVTVKVLAADVSTGQVDFSVVPAAI